MPITNPRVDEGFKIIMDIAGVTAPLYWEQEITPPEINGGDAINVANQRNTAYITKAPRTLIEIGDLTVVVSSSTGAYAQLMAIINKNKQVTLTYPDLYTQVFFASLRTVRPASYTIGGQPRWTLTFTVTNIDPATGNEVGPVETAPS